MRHDIINDVISSIKNAERIGESELTVKSPSKLLVEVLTVFQKTGHIGEFEVTKNQQGGSIRIILIKQINDCGVVKPRSSVKHGEFHKWEKRFLPSRDFGVLVVSTPKGAMSHNEAKKQGLGGRVIAYVY